MPKMTFRTEGFGDGKRVPALLKELGVTEFVQKEVPDPVNPRWLMDFFTFDVDDELESFRTKMQALIYGDNKMFANLHRCEQTLAVGDEPNEQWYDDGTLDLPKADTIAKMKEAADKRNK